MCLSPGAHAHETREKDDPNDVQLSQFKRILTQVFLLPVLALLVTAAVLYWHEQSANATVELIQQSDARVSQTNLITRLIIDQESGLRGYQITGDERFLQPFLEAQQKIPQEFAHLGDTSTTDSQRLYVAQLRDSQRIWEESFARPVIATLRGGGNANDVELNLRGKVLVDAIRAQTQSIIEGAEKRRSDRIALWRQQVRDSVYALVAITLLVGILVGLFVRHRLHQVAQAYRTSLEDLSRHSEEVFQSEQQLRATLDSIGDGVITCDSDGRIAMMNPVAVALTGWPLATAQGRPLQEIFHIVNERTRELVENPVKKVQRLDAIVDLANHSILIRPDATEIHVADSAAPIRDHNGTIAGIVMVFRDVTLARRTQEALLASEKLAVAGRLAATIAHEIHNPLDSVSNLLYLMRSDCTPQESVQFMEMAQQELGRVTQISRAMLGLYRESKEPVPVDLKQMLEEILLLMERRIGDLGVTVSTQLPDQVVVEGFPAELRQVFTNLIINAAEATGKGGLVTVCIQPQLANHAPGGKVDSGATVVIADNGPGISPDVQANLFRPFFTTKGEHGTGLGLWISRGIINKHAGKISFNSDISPARHGTQVSVFLATKPVINAG